ncbi:MAG: protein-L-isoaspartate(D-aspartate) O-methyltransferase [Rhizobiaceae bacterium]
MKDRREAIVSLMLRLRAMGLPHPLMAAFEAVPRQNFVPIMHLDESYTRGQLPIECGQIMISADQVAQQLKSFDVQKKHRVLEIGTGTGYQSALLGHMASRVTSLERYRTLVDKAQQRLENLGIDNVVVMLADGSSGASEQIFDRIIVNCSCEKVPGFVEEQLASGGLAIVPVGPADGRQMVRLVSKTGSRAKSEELFEVRMQPMVSGISKAI